MRQIDFLPLLELFSWTMHTLTHPTMRNLLDGSYEGWLHGPGRDYLLARAERDKLIHRQGRGLKAKFRLSDAGLQRLHAKRPHAHWDKPWDGAWRVITFDLPELRRTDRVALWRALRARKIGFLQRSVWIWPHELQPALQEMIHAGGVPECFCGFTAREVFLCTNAEIVAASWKWEEIDRRQRGYESGNNLNLVARARDVAALAAAARAEHLAYRHAFTLDPLLPRSLWPKSYRGEIVQLLHQSFRRRLHQRFQELSHP